MTIQLFCTVLVLNEAGCQSSEKLVDQGVVAMRFQIFDSTATPWLNNYFRIWFKDSLIIQQINRTDIYADSAGEKSELITTHFTFIDLRTNKFRDYTSFSDTATLLKKYMQEDSTGVNGGWNFYYQRPFLASDKGKHLSDTVINGVTHKRMQFMRNPQKPFSSIVFFRCDEKLTRFPLFAYPEAWKGCATMTKVHSYKFPSNRLSNIYEVDFVSDSLSADEIRVFDAWEKELRIGN